MKNIKRLGYIVLIVIIAILSFTIYANASKDDSKNQKDKAFAEIKFIETKMANLFNSMNNIESRNYSVVTSELSKETTEKSEQDSSSQGESGGGQGGGGSSGGGESSGRWRFVRRRRIFRRRCFRNSKFIRRKFFKWTRGSK